MMVVTPDEVLTRAVQRLTAATGSSAEFFEHESRIDDNPKPIDLAVFDARRCSPGQTFSSKVPETARVLYILKPGALARRIKLLESPQTTSLFCRDEPFDDDEFIASATRALRGDIFGLQEYLPCGVAIFSMQVVSYAEKSMAIDKMMDCARASGVRGPVRDRVQLVADELMMNALYHAPTDEHGRELNHGKTPKQLSQLENIAPIEVQYGCSARYFGISVRDGFGSLTRTKALEYLKRAGRCQRQIEEKSSGAGLGLISVLRSASKVVFNLAPGHSTEAICFLDMQLQSEGMAGARSLHLFTAASNDPDHVNQQTAIAQVDQASMAAPVVTDLRLLASPQ